MAHCTEIARNSGRLLRQRHFQKNSVQPCDDPQEEKRPRIWLNIASYGMTDTMGRMHSDAQFAGSSSVPAHVEMMGFLGIGNNPMVGCTVACAVDCAQALSK